MPTASPWTPERTAKHNELWRDGLSGQEIADRLGNGLTRQAVITKARRMGLPYRAGPMASVSEKSQSQTSKRFRNKPHKIGIKSAVQIAHERAQAMAHYEAVRQLPEVEIPKAERKTLLIRDAEGRLHANDSFTSKCCRSRGVVGIDLGLRDIATLSTGDKVENLRHYRRCEAKLGNAQRARKKRLTRAIATKIAQSRKDHLHKASARIALAHNLIFVGNVSSQRLARTKMAKSVLDAGWSMLRTQLSYKAMRHGGMMVEVNEYMTTQTCSSCGSQDASERPRGIAGLGIRRWTCGGCGATHDRDVNAAQNIVRSGLATLAEGAATERSSHASLRRPETKNDGDTHAHC